jgi:hypothetical protein
MEKSKNNLDGINSNVWLQALRQTNGGTVMLEV